MPHAERTPNGDPYFQSIKNWIGIGKQSAVNGEQMKGLAAHRSSLTASQGLQERHSHSVEIFIDTLIVNNEERTLEQAARCIAPGIQLKQFRYLSPSDRPVEDILTTIALFNPNKERAYVRSNGDWSKWNPDKKALELVQSPLQKISLLRRDEPDVGGHALGKGSETGICYSYDAEADGGHALQKIFANPHSSKLEFLK